MSTAAEQSGTEEPVKRRGERPWERAFLTAYARNGIVLDGCEAADVGRTTVYALRKSDTEFAVAMDEAYEAAADALERKVLESPEPVLKIFMLKGMRPEKYRERFEHSGRIDHADVTDPEARDRRLAELVSAAMKRQADGAKPEGVTVVTSVRELVGAESET